MLLLNISVKPIHAAARELEAGTSYPTAEESTEETQKLILETTSSFMFGFKDVDAVHLNLDVPGEVQCIATAGESIGVVLEKQARATHMARDVAIRTYLENIAMTSTQNDGVLQLKLQLPEDTGTQGPPNPSAGVKNGPATFRDRLQVKCIIKTPADVSLKLQVKRGDVRIQGVHGKIEIETEAGDLHLNETLGNYNVTLTDGNIKGEILLTRGQNTLETKNGTIALTLLDTVAAPMDITAQGGNILLQLPEDYAIDALLESQKQQVVVNLPAQFDDETTLAIVNGGGPLFRLKSTGAISLLQNISAKDQTDIQEGTGTDSLLESAQPVPQTMKPPIIDGNLSELAWQTAAALSPFQNPEGTEESDPLTEVFLMWDDQNLYIGVHAHSPTAQLPRLSQTQHDSPIWEDECIEILIDADPQTEVYHHLVVNPIGAHFDQQVSEPGEVSFQFAPRDVQRDPDQGTPQTTFQADSAWNAGAKVETRINATSWSLEIALPREALEKRSQTDGQTPAALKNIALFNVHRKAQLTVRDTEHLVSTTQRVDSYWLPTYYDEYPWWPHAPQEYAAPLSERIAPAMGVLHFVQHPSFVSETFGDAARFRVAAIEVEGNTVLPTAVVQQHVPIQPGDVITSTQLSWILAELRNQDWFQDVRLETEQVGTPDGEVPERLTAISVRVKVTEAPVLFARQIKIDGNRSFPATFIKEWFQLENSYIPVEVARRKGQLIADFYANRGYEFATVTHELADDVLTFRVSEGALHEIRFTGNARISRAELLSALDIKTPGADGELNSQASDVYHRTLGQSKINQMRKRLSKDNEHFKSVQNWRVQREGGKNIMVVEIEEQPLTQTSSFPILQFNRVHGLLLGGGGTLATQIAGKERIFGSVSRGFSSKIWNYQGGIEKIISGWHTLKFGGSAYRLTDINASRSLGPNEVNLGAAYFGFDLQDYYQRRGVQGWVTYATSEWSSLRLEATRETHDNLSKSTDWSYLNRNLIKRGNARIDRGQLESLSLIYTFDTRDHKSTVRRYFWEMSSPNERTRRGWRGQFAVEIADGDYVFNLYRFELARYTPLFGPHHLHVRMGGDFSNAPLPRQRLLYLGGTTTLRGYGFNRFAGDNRLVFNVEYRLMEERIVREPDVVFGWALSCFLDTGIIWWHGDPPFSDVETFMGQLKTAVGVGCSLFIDPSGDPTPWSVAVEIAEPLDASFSLQNPKLILRLDRIF